ncbi:MAG: ImmA/IrrE family metallo-endopeptidase [Parachlamydiales bacterium]|jgi:plasmid maintenance system antidote protein VapI
MLSTGQFSPDWICPPGDTIADLLGERKWSTSDFATRIGATSDYVANLLQGRSPVTEELAENLARTLGASPAFWLNREAQYRSDLTRSLESARHLEQEHWLKGLPVKDMVQFGWIKPFQSAGEGVAACLAFFGASNLSSWRERYADVFDGAAFRKSASFESHAGATAAWLRQGAIESASIDCQTWDAVRFRATLPKIRAVTRLKNLQDIVATLRKLCAECGVAIVFLRTPSGCRASGATFFVSPDKAVMLLSFRYLSDDHFWFSLFHEAGHLLLHDKKGLFVEGEGPCSDKEETEANEFSSTTLIPPEYQPRLLALRANVWDIVRFAKSIGISPGIVVGQLQHLKVLKRNHFNNLKSRYTWNAE